MENKEKEYRKLKFGLTIKKFMDQKGEPETKGNNDDSGNQDKNRSLSFRKLESSSGIRHATIVEIVNGKKNAAWSTVDALLDGLGISLAEFASVYDNLTEQEVIQYKKELEKRKQEREKKKKGKRKPK
jgi:hypothetical protein